VWRRRLPVDARAVFAILAERTRSGDSVALPLHEIELATGTSPADLAPHIEMLERYQLAALEEEWIEDRPNYWSLGAFYVDGWKFWRDFRQYCEERGLRTKDVINDLRFELLD